MATKATDGLVDGDPMQAPVLVTGARGAVERDRLIDAIAEATEDLRAVVQAFDPGAVYGAEHLRAAARRALRSHAEGREIARDLAVEIALYAAGTTQIDEALETVGVPVEAQALVLAAVGPDREQAVDAVIEVLGIEVDEDVVSEDEGALERLGISAGALETVDEEQWTLLVVEQVALLDART